MKPVKIALEQLAVSTIDCVLIHITRQQHALAFCGESIGRRPAYEARMSETVFPPTCFVCIVEAMWR